jgi:hypothetical protein
MHRRPAGTAARSNRKEAAVPTWFWLNIPLAAVIFLAVVGVPLWMVFKHPDTGQEIAEAAARHRARRQAAIPIHGASMDEAVRWHEAA